MGFRTIVIKSRVKLELRLNLLIVRGEVEKRIFINEINTLIIQSTAVSVTAALLNELVKNNIKVIFCDEKCSPSFELIPYYGTHNSSKKLKIQRAWTQDCKDIVWQAIIKQKILEQSKVLLEHNFLEEARMLTEYAEQVCLRDTTNREGHAAKVYFNALLSDGGRSGDSKINGYLNYGYSILLSAFNREVVAAGYLTQLGIWHDNEFNQFNLSCDLMEPFRPLVDRIALSLAQDDKDFKNKLIDILNYEVEIGGQNTTMDLAIRKYTLSVFDVLESRKIQDINFITRFKFKDEQ